MPEDPMTKPRETTRRSEGIPEREVEQAKKRTEEKKEGGGRSERAVRQDRMLGDISPRDETTR